MPKRNKNKKRVKKKVQKRNYNHMIEESSNFNIKEEKPKKLTNPKKKELSNLDEKTKENFFNFNFQIDKTYMPPPNTIKESVENRKLNLPIYNLLLASYDPDSNKNNLKNLKIKEDCLNNNTIYKDGNCFFRSISTFFSNSEEYHLFFRNLIYDYIRANYDELISEFPYIYYNGKSIDLDDYIPLIKVNGTYAGEFECNIISKMFSINILLLEYIINQENNENYYSYITYFGKLEKNSYQPLCILEFQQNIKHFEILYFDNNYRDSEILFEENDCLYEHQKKNNNKSGNINKKNTNIKNVIKNDISNSVNKLNNFENNLIEEITDLSLDKKDNIHRNEDNNIKFSGIDIENETKINPISDVKIQITKDIINHLNNLLKNEIINIENNYLNKQKEESIHLGHDYPTYPLSYISPEEFYADIYIKIYFN